MKSLNTGTFPPVGPAHGPVAVPAVVRAIAVLEAVAEAREPLSLAQLTSVLHFPKSSLLGICGTLVMGGLLQRTTRNEYRLGARIIGLAHTFLAKSNITESFFEACDASESLHGETVVLSVLDGSEVVYVACRNGAQALTFTYRIGARLPANCSASGKAILSTLPIAMVQGLFPNYALTTLTPNSVATFDKLVEELAVVRKRRFALDNQGVREGMCCIGAPIFELSNPAACAAVALSLQSAEFKSAARYKAALQTVTRLAEELSRRLGGKL